MWVLFMSIRWEHIGALSSMSSEWWAKTSSQYQDKYFILTQNKDVYACKGDNDLEGEVKTVTEIAQLIQEREMQLQPASSSLKEKEVIDETMAAKVPKNDEDSLSILSTTFDPLHYSRTQRESYLDTAGEKPWTKNFIEFQKNLDELLSVESISEDAVQNFVAVYKSKYNVSLSDFEPLFVNRSGSPSLREKLLNIAFNKYKSIQEINDFIETKKEAIIAEHAPNEYKDIPKENFRFEIELKGKETHNKGKLPAKIVFFKDGVEVFSVMYKPRAAAIDNAVQELLSNCQMPFYKITSYPDENKSIWTYIDGQDMLLSAEERHKLRFGGDSRLKTEGARRTPEAFIQHSSSLQDGQRNDLLTQLNHLNRILLCINITDLHGENVRLGADGNIYPIDLEVMDERQGTLLMINDYSDNTEKSRAQA